MTELNIPHIGIEVKHAEAIDHLVKTRQKALEMFVASGIEGHTLILPTISLPHTLLPVLIPKRIYELAHDTTNLKLAVGTIQEGAERDTLELLCVESNYPLPLTDGQALQRYLQTLQMTIRAGVPNPPSPPNTIDPLHIRLREYLQANKLLLTDKVMLNVTLSKSHLSPLVLYVENYDGQQHQGLAKDFYLNTLPFFARTLGFRFIAGSNSPQNWDFFIKKLGRTPAKALKKEDFAALFPQEYSDEITIHFLYSDDKKKMIR